MAKNATSHDLMLLPDSVISGPGSILAFAQMVPWPVDVALAVAGLLIVLAGTLRLCFLGCKAAALRNESRSVSRSADGTLRKGSSRRDEDNTRHSPLKLSNYAALNTEDGDVGNWTKEPEDLDWYPAFRFVGRRLVVVLESAALDQAAVIAVPGATAEDRSAAELELKPAFDCLTHLLESPLNQAGRLLVYMHSARGMLVEVNPVYQVPKDIRRFARSIAIVVRKGRVVRSNNKGASLMRVLQEQMQDLLPSGCPAFAVSNKGRAVDLKESFTLAFKEWPLTANSEVIAFAIRVAATESESKEHEIGAAYVKAAVSINPGSWPLRSVGICHKLCAYFEGIWTF